MQAILAAIPILLILILMVGFRWGATRAGSAGYIAAFFISIVFFGSNFKILAYAHAKAFLLTIDVLLIIWSAFLLYQVAHEAGAIKIIGDSLPYLTKDRDMQAILIGWVFASFLQGAGGFGEPVAITAPILIGLGFNPIAAVVIPSIGHGWAVNFGSLGSAYNALMSSTNLNSNDLAPYVALFLGLASLLTGFLVSHAADGWAGVKRLLVKAILIGLTMGGVQYLLAIAGLWNIASFGGGLAGLIISFPLAQRGLKKHNNTNEKLAIRPLLTALSAYGILIMLTVIIFLIPPINEILGRSVIKVNFPQTISNIGYFTPSGTNRPIHILTHAGTILFFSSLISYWIYTRNGLYKKGAVRRIITQTIKSVMPSNLSIAVMVAMALIMQQSGMTEAIALGLAVSVGSAFPIIAPWIGALGAIMTGSNTNSNVIFAPLQMRTAELLSYRVPIILAAQTAGASLASVIAPTKVVVGASTAGMVGREGEIMRSLAIYTIVLLLFISLLTLLAIFFWK